jgi:hypothetical protein
MLSVLKTGLSGPIETNQFAEPMVLDLRLPAQKSDGNAGRIHKINARRSEALEGRHHQAG